MRVFIISGKARHGKTTTAEYLSDILGNSVITSYSRYVKMYVNDMNMWDNSESNKPRKLLQDLGNTIRNELFSIDFFAKRIDEDIKVYSLYRDNVIIDGARLPIEIDYFKDKYSNVYSIRVIRSDYDNELNLKEKSDETEVALDNYSNYDYTIMNDGSFSDLRDKVNKCLEDLL